ncbi:MAG: dethiobiotin synthase [Acidithiobacillus sp.]
MTQEQPSPKQQVRQARGLFITGTDTGVGKTAVTAALTQLCAGHGMRVAALKPIVSGVETDGTWEDVEILRAASQPPRSIAETNLYAFDPPLAPHWAAQQAGVTVDRGRVAAFVRAQSVAMDCVLVEGAGGFLVPLGADWGFAELAEDLHFPVLLVVGLRLGAINHTLLSVEAIRTRGLSFAGWVANTLNPAVAEGTLETLQQRLSAPCLGVLPYIPHWSAAVLSPYLSLPASLY